MYLKYHIPACLILDFAQVTFPGLTAFADTANNSFSSQELAQTEVIILDTLHWRVAIQSTTKNILDNLIDDFGLETKVANFATYLVVRIDYFLVIDINLVFLDFCCMHCHWNANLNY